MKTRGCYVVVEGGDAVGKTTAVRALRRTFRSDDVVFVKEPGGTVFGQKARTLLLSMDLDPVSELFLFLSARRELFRSVILPALANGKTVIADRGDASTYAYQVAGHRELSALFVEGNRMAMLGIEPDLTILLEASDDVVALRIAKRARGGDRFETRGPMFRRQVARAYRRYLADRPHVIVDGSSDAKGMEKTVIGLVRSFTEG